MFGNYLAIYSNSFEKKNKTFLKFVKKSTLINVKMCSPMLSFDHLRSAEKPVPVQWLGASAAMSFNASRYVYILNTLQIDRKHDTFILFCLEANVYICSPFLVFFCFLGGFLLAKLKLLFLESKINVKRLLQTLCTYLLLFIYLSHKFVCYQYLFLSPSVFILVKLLVKKADKLKLLTLLRV